ncbi:MAG: hypothetical protein NVS3B19_20510 [Ginsengibacter sp.]
MIPVINLDITKPIPQTEIMEVHKHPHHVTHKKKWGEYLLEFFMLFLAVFLGFVAENIREHYVEKQQVKVLATALLTDLQKDTAQINFLEKNRLDREMRLDSFFVLLHTPNKEINKNIFYRLLRRIYGIYSFSQSRATIDQLKNAGYLRYFSDNKLLHYLSDYEFAIQDYKADENIGMKWYDKFIEFTINNVDQDIIDNIMQNKIYPQGTGIPELIPEVSKHLTAIVVIQRANSKLMKNQNENLKRKANEIMQYVSSKYHLENE